MTSEKDGFSMERDDQLVDSINSIYYKFVMLKQLKRRGWLQAGINNEECESVGEHILGVVFLAMLLCDGWYSHLDKEKVLKMSMIHDLCEIYTGDIIPNDQVTQEEKIKREKESIKKVFQNLFNSQDYLRIWDEYSDKETPESRFVHQVDKLEMALQASFYQRQTGIDLNEFIFSAFKKLEDPLIKQLIQEFSN